MSDNEVIVRQFLDAMLEGNQEALDDVFDKEAIWHGGILGEANGLDEFKALTGQLMTGMTLTSIKIEDIVASGDKVVARLTASGTHSGTFLGYRATGKPFEYKLTNTYRLSGGKIVEDWHLGDYLGFLQQTGAITSPG